MGNANLQAWERKRALQRFPSSDFKRIAVVAIGEPSKDYKEHIQKILLDEKIVEAEKEKKRKEEEKKWKEYEAEKETRKRKAEHVEKTEEDEAKEGETNEDETKEGETKEEEKKEEEQEE